MKFEIENNAPPCVILKTITIKRGLLHKIYEEFAWEIVVSSQMCREQSKRERIDCCRFYRNGQFITVGYYITRFIGTRVSISNSILLLLSYLKQVNSITKESSYSLLLPCPAQNFGLIYMQSRRNPSV